MVVLWTRPVGQEWWRASWSAWWIAVVVFWHVALARRDRRFAAASVALKVTGRASELMAAAAACDLVASTSDEAEGPGTFGRRARGQGRGAGPGAGRLAEGGRKEGGEGKKKKEGRKEEKKGEKKGKGK
jgi:hypothetical protein